MSMLTESVLFIYFSFLVMHKIMAWVTVGVLHLTKSIINSLLSWDFLFLAVKSFRNDIACNL